ncbi:F-box domain containing protein [Tanacetum coccineum]|uniref:F-box domain containing protein n=1 Tax=Tanacetum coccineum TaxID=301880 RepID=A0ABQ4YI07_9ASTR
MSRLKDSNTLRKEVPKKVLHYFPIIPRLQCLYKSSYTAKEMTWHATRNCTKPGFMGTEGVETIDVAIGQKFNMRAMVALRRGGHLRPQWMYPFKRYMKKLKGYVQNKAKPEGSIAVGYVAEEALTFSSHYFLDVTTKFNRPDRNVDPLPASVSSFRCCDLMSSADVARSHGGDGGGDDRPPSHVDAHETPLLVRDFYEEDNQHLQKAYNTNKASFKAKHWNADPTTETYDVEAIRQARPEEITAAEWDKYIQFWNDPKNLARAAQNRLNRQKSVVISRQGSRSLARLRDEMGQASRHQDYHSNSLTTSGGTHTVDGVFPKDAGPPHFGLRLRVYPEDEIKCLLARRVVSFGRTIPGVGRVLPSTGPPGQVEATTSLDMFKRFWSGGARGVVGVVYDEDEWRMIEDDDGEEGRSPATCRWGKVCHRGTNCLTEKRVGPTSSLGIIAGDCIPDEYSPATIPQRHVAGETFPQRHVAGENPEMSLGKTPIVVVFLIWRVAAGSAESSTTTTFVELYTAKDMIWHATRKCTKPGKMQHPVHGGAWKKFDTKYLDFAKEPRNVRLGHNIASATLMEDDMLKSQIKVVDILCELELIYPPALFDIIVYLVIHLPIEALEGGPIHPRWMYPFE